MKPSGITAHSLAHLPTPVYLYDLTRLETTVSRAAGSAKQHGFHIHYALKANTEPLVLEVMQRHGLGADCVSGNEVKHALDHGFLPRHVVFAGVGKTDAEINLALRNNIFCFNCESVEELRVISELAAAAGTEAGLALRINPNVDARTHSYITTGLDENKFGIGLTELDAALGVLHSLPNVRLIGIHFHIGSQITNLEVFRSLCLRINEIKRWFISHNVHPEVINVGGGLGIDYHHPETDPDFEAYFGCFDKFLERSPGQKVYFELGRALVGQCGTLLTRVLYVKPGRTKTFVIADAGMNDLMRPALYGAFHLIENLSSKGLASPYEVVGPVCESSDCFGSEVLLPPTHRGDLLAIRSAGAYGAVMASGYNLRPLPEAFFLRDGQIIGF